MTNQEAIEILKKYKDESEEDYYVKRAEALDKGIEALESQKTGHWNFTLNADKDSWIVKCSCCRYERLEILDTRYGLKKIKIMYAGELKQDKYCLNCGAKIEGE